MERNGVHAIDLFGNGRRRRSPAIADDLFRGELIAFTGGVSFSLTPDVRSFRPAPDRAERRSSVLCCP